MSTVDEGLGPLLAELRSDSAAVRRDAAEALGELGDARAVEPLIAALKDRNSDVRVAAIRALVRLVDGRAIEPLIAALKDEDNDVRSAAAEALGQLGDARAVEPLIALLNHENDQARLASVVLLGQPEGALVALYLKAAGVHQTALEALKQLGYAAVEPLIVAFKDEADGVREVAAEALRRLGEAAVLPLIDALGDDSIPVRLAATRLLSQLNDTRAVEPLNIALQDEEGNVRWVIAEALGQLGDARAVESLIATLKSEDVPARWAAAEALGRLSDIRAVEPLIAVLQDETSNAYWVGIGALGCPDDTRIVEPVIAALKDKNRKTRAAVAEMLGNLGDVRAVEPLIAALKDEDVHWAAAEALGRLDDAVVEPRLAILGDESSQMFWEAARTRKMAGGSEASETYLAILHLSDLHMGHPSTLSEAISGADRISDEVCRDKVGGDKIARDKYEIHLSSPTTSLRSVLAFANLREDAPVLRPEPIRLDVAAPRQATVGIFFWLAVAVRQPDSPSLSISDLPDVTSEEGEILRSPDQPIVKYRVHVTAPDFEVPEASYVFMLEAGRDSKPRYLLLKPLRPGSLLIAVSAYQIMEDEDLAAQTRLRIETRLEVME
jgi:HEAT repeat protein